ncbi:hypothetical protein JX265_008752 [Neoarthrinium moseri]|uniref:Major facilitator superfamily (MFS) profile domain-containing protein n=1 Tax=Neoarthrinium moseri TaxID=1658444 RepID=A0A9P9WHH8_9PEZI|nr:uncharacterized protein JN550_008772 [Neoarthrinium moseri]KAI1848466.1 hypothetical protein JX266_005772 [Neoarthrinium moseri]KAI1863535.1 hypothetical protein JX265_008752 [Neoarthrinium moseri]KAI1864485.1 hypothetical protein JN550_008772 [Neoarthrinium moseri]
MDENLNEKEIQELEEVLNTKIYPGTEILKDVGNYHFVKNGGGNDSRVLVPQPTDDPHDPLNWSPMWKGIAMGCATMLSVTLNLGPLANAPLFGDYMKEWNCTLEEAVQFTGVTILVLGFSNFLWVPLAATFGRRPVMIFSTLICAVSSIWRAQATSYNSFMGAAILNGVAAGPCETLQPQIIADIIFLHDRGKYQTLYFTMYFGSLMVGPIIAGSMAFNLGWRSFWWLNTGLLFLSLIVSLAFPETRYHRVYDSNPRVAPEPLTQPLETGSQKGKTDPNAIEHSEQDKDSLGSAAKDGGLAPVLTHQDPWLGRGKPSKAQFRLYQPFSKDQVKVLLRELWVPWYLHLFPIVEFASFAVSFTASGFLVANLSETQVFAAPPYNYSAQTIGLFNLAILAGALIGLFTNGPWSDWVAAYFTKRNGGIREPEMRLPAMIPYVFILIIGTVVMAVGYDDHWAWQVIVIVGWGCLGIQVAALPAIASTYAIDSYKPATGSLFVAITVNKNVWGYGVSKFLTPWAESSGFKVPILVNMALIVFFCSTGIIFWFWGKKMRGMTKNSIVHRL